MIQLALNIGAASAFLAGCGGAQAPIGLPRAAAPNVRSLRSTPHLAFAANFGSNNVSAYIIDARTGALKQAQGSPFGAGLNPRGIAIVPSGKFLYVANEGSNSLSAYTVNPTDGTLTPVKGSPFETGADPWGVAVGPGGKFVYVTDAEACNSCPGYVSVFAIDAKTGVLTPARGSPFTVGVRPLSIAIDPTGRFAYVANDLSASVSAYTINAQSGALTEVQGSPFEAGFYPDSITVDPVRNYVYETNYESSDIVGYSINENSGVLTPLKKAPFKTGFEPAWVTVNPAGTFAYVTDYAVGVKGYAIGARTGDLRKIKGPPLQIYNAAGVAVDPTGKFAYVAGTDSTGGVLYAYTIDASTGGLTAVPGSPFPAGGYPCGVAIW